MLLRIYLLALVGALSPSAPLLLVRFPRPQPRAGPRRRHATASWAYLLRLIKAFSSSLGWTELNWALTGGGGGGGGGVYYQR